MPCDLTKGRSIPCKNRVGGIKAVYFFNFGDPERQDIAIDSSGNITSLGENTAYKYALKGVNQLDENITTSRENGTTFVEQVITLQLPGMSKEDKDEVMLMAAGRPRIVVVDRNNTALLCGLEDGCDLTTANFQTGAGHGDFSGGNLVFTAMEADNANQLTGATALNPFAGMADTITIDSD